LLGFAFHPDFPATPEAFVSYTRTGAPLVSYVSRFFSTDAGLTLSAGSEEVILTVLQEAANHNGGDLHFGPDGNLYLGLGDSGGVGDPRDYAQNTSTLHGSIVRLNIDGATPYDIPAGNPFSTSAQCTQGFGSAPCPEIFAWGLRNPWRFSFDTSTGKLWAGDVGQGSWEEIDVIAVGENYGWNDREGAHCFDPPSGCATNFVDPVTEYDHSMGTSVTGGYVYRGSAIPDLVGWYVFGDFGSGALFAIPEDSQPDVMPEVLEQTGLSIVSFAQDNDGELYLLDFSVGTIHKVLAAP
jgi:glucose/arabinose dehydrogenase